MLFRDIRELLLAYERIVGHSIYLVMGSSGHHWLSGKSFDANEVVTLTNQDDELEAELVSAVKDVAQERLNKLEGKIDDN